MSRKLLALALLAIGTAALALGGRALLDDPDRAALRKGQELLASGSLRGCGAGAGSDSR